MKLDHPETSGHKTPELSELQSGSPASIWSNARVGYAHLSASVLRSSAVKDSMLLRKAVFGALTSVALSANAGQIAPPPLPPGSAQVKIVPGQSTEETKKMERAHHHAKHEKKDYELDDSDDVKDKDKPAKK